jgi:N,N'-diacetyllegionaminate synthase
MKKVKIIAEIGPNHNGKVYLAKKLIKEAKKAGADYVKFQTFVTEDIITVDAKKAKYQISNKNKKETQFSMLKKLELSQSSFKILHRYSKKLGIKFLSTAFDIKSLHFINSLKPDYFKIPSGEITNLPLIKEITKFKRKIILSTGMANLREVSKTFKFLLKNGVNKKKITILHCNTEYPSPMEDVNLNVLKTFQKKFKTKFGYSDHTLGVEVAIAAVAMGSQIIEKHFTLNRKMVGPDHKASLDPKEFKFMVQSIRNIEKALGGYKKKVTKSEKKNIDIARKSIVAKKEIKKGEKFTIKNLCIKRPGNGLSPMNWFKILGKISKKNYFKDQLI